MDKLISIKELMDYMTPTGKVCPHIGMTDDDLSELEYMEFKLWGIKPLYNWRWTKILEDRWDDD